MIYTPNKMINVAGLTDYALADKVLEDGYFMSELDNIDYLIALVCEEFTFKESQLDILYFELQEKLKCRI